MGGIISQQEQEPSHHPPEEIEGWLLIGPGIEESCEVFVSEDIHTGPSREPCSADRPIHKCPSDPELPRSRFLFDPGPLPSIIEESLSCDPGPSSPQHTRSSSADSGPLLQDTSPLSSLESRPRDKSRTASVESRTARTASVESRTTRTASVESREIMSLAFPEVADSVGSGRSLNLRCDLDSFRHPSNSNSDCGSGRLPSEGFQLDYISTSTLQDSPVESILMETRRTFRDDGFLAAVRFLQGHIDQDPDREVSRSLLHEACAQGTDVFTFNIVLMNVDKNMVNHRNERLDDRTPLAVACTYLPLTINERTRWLEEQQKTKITKLLSLSSDCTLPDKDGNTPLHLATLHNNADCVKLILKNTPTCRDIANNLGNTSLHIACREGRLSVISVLLEHQANARLLNRTKKQRCPLHQAIVKGHTKVVEVLVNYDPGVVDCTDGKRMQPLHLALKHRSAAMAVSLLSQQHCPVTWPDADGRTPLHYACEWGESELVGWLLKTDSSHSYINTQDNHGDSALHLAYRHGNCDIVTLLKSKNASKKITNKAGETAKEAGVNAGHPPHPKKGIRGLFNSRRRDHFPRMSSTDSLLTSTSSAHSLLTSTSSAHTIPPAGGEPL
ncbi:probable serine/threonine-protein kinase DDB_G0278535 [Halichondria panicea]|uniref:probable serine/threonine-protein kinase DDB_G0278535 n=1 Tax=Halichondria panicea TaxID=6063 RepID=UPI00312B5874